MAPRKTFTVFGELVEVLVSGEMTGGRSAAITQASPPGGGPPPHSHEREDETFYILEGEFELLLNGEWHKAAPGQTHYAPRGSVHTFRNSGSVPGKILVFIAPAGLEKYLEEISPLSIPRDMDRLIAISDRYGISFPEKP